MSFACGSNQAQSLNLKPAEQRSHLCIRQPGTGKVHVKSGCCESCDAHVVFLVDDDGDEGADGDVLGAVADEDFGQVPFVLQGAPTPVCDEIPDRQMLDNRWAKISQS